MNHPSLLCTVAASFLAPWALGDTTQGASLPLPKPGAAPQVTATPTSHARRPGPSKLRACIKHRPHILIRILPRYREHPRAHRIRSEKRHRRSKSTDNHHPKAIHGPACNGANCKLPERH